MHSGLQCKWSLSFTPKASCNFSQHHSFFPASIPLPLSRNDSAEIVNQKRLLRALEQLTNRLKRTLSKQPFSTFHVSSEMIVADPKSLESKKAALYCRPGSVLKGRVCGEFENEIHIQQDTSDIDSGVKDVTGI